MQPRSGALRFSLSEEGSRRLRLNVEPLCQSQRTTMNQPSARLGGLLFLLALASVSCSQERPTIQQADRVSDESEIRAVLTANQKATNQRDSKAVAATFTSDADLLVANGPKFVGVNEIQQSEEEFYSTPGFKEWHATVESIRFLTDDVAIVEQSVSTILDSGEIRENASVVMLRHDGDWKIAAVRVLGKLKL